MMWWRPWLAALRLGLYYALFCFGLLYAALQVRDCRENNLSSSASPAPLPASRPLHLGATVELEQYASAAQRQALTRLHTGGLTWVRQRFDWRVMEPQPGRFDWRAADTMLANIVQSGLTPVVVLDGSPARVRDPRDRAPHDNPLAPPADPATFARFAAAFAARYGALVRYYQIWHEPNIAPHWGDRHIEPIEYARLLSAAGRAIRAADADAQIITAALAPTADRGHTAMDEAYFLQRLYAAARLFDSVPPSRNSRGAEASAQIFDPLSAFPLSRGLGRGEQLPTPRLFDMVAVEPFGFGHAATDSRQRLDVLNFQRVRLVRDVMAAAGDGATPLWAVRMGWNRRPDSPWGVVAAADQVRFARQAATLAQANWPWLDALGWAVDQPNAPAADPMWGFALDDQLLRAFAGAEATPSSAEPLPRQATPSPFRFWLQIGLLMLLWPVILQRGRAAWRMIHWPGWLHGAAIDAISWAVLAWLYAVAVWPPLIGLCWLGFARLAWRNPQRALGLAAALLPFTFQHKELAIVDWQWQIPPAHMLLWALLPALAGDFWRFLLVNESSPSLTSLDTRSVGIPMRRLWSPSRLRPLDWLALAWLVVNLASNFNVWHWSAYGQGLMEQALAPLLLYAGARMWAGEAVAQRRLAMWLFAGGALAALWGWAGWLQGAGTLADGVRRLVGPHFSPNHTALYLERTLFLGVGLAVGARGLRQWGWIMSCAVVLGALLLTFSRGALLMALPVAAVFFYVCAQVQLRQLYGGHRWRRGHWVAVLCGCALLLLCGWLFADRLTNSASVAQRFASWRAAWQLWRDYPLLGVGPGGFFWRYPAYTLENAALDPNLRHPHNLWLEFAASWGLVGLGWLGALLGALWRQLRQLDVEAGLDAAQADWPILWLTIGIGAGIVAGLTHGQVDAFMALADLASWNWLALALLATPFFSATQSLQSDRSQSSM